MVDTAIHNNSISTGPLWISPASAIETAQLKWKTNTICTTISHWILTSHLSEEENNMLKPQMTWLVVTAHVYYPAIRKNRMQCIWITLVKTVLHLNIKEISLSKEPRMVLPRGGDASIWVSRLLLLGLDTDLFLGHQHTISLAVGVLSQKLPPCAS